MNINVIESLVTGATERHPRTEVACHQTKIDSSKRIRLTVQRFANMRLSTARELLKLTNNINNMHDRRDDGTFPGSSFRVRLDEFIHYNFTYQQDCWIVLARDPAEGRIIGWCMIERYDSTPGRQHYHDGVMQIYVDPHERSRGIARKLFERALKLARDNSLISLTANPWNARGRHFFESVGFKLNKPSNPKASYTARLEL